MPLLIRKLFFVLLLCLPCHADCKDDINRVVDSLKLEGRLKDLEHRVENSEIKVESAVTNLAANKDFLEFKSEKLDKYITLIACILSILTIAIGFIVYGTIINIKKQTEQAIQKVNSESEQAIQKVNEESEKAISQVYLGSDNAMIDINEKAKATMTEVSKEADSVIKHLRLTFDSVKKDADSLLDLLMEHLARRGVSVDQATKDIIEVVGIENAKTEIIKEEYKELRDNYMVSHLSELNKQFEGRNWKLTYQAISKYLKYDSNNSDIFYKRGICQLKLQYHVGKAIESFNKALTIDANNCKALYGLVYCYKDNENYKQQYIDAVKKLESLNCKDDPIQSLF